MLLGIYSDLKPVSQESTFIVRSDFIRIENFCSWKTQRKAPKT